jgi:hypothetical protein
MKGSVWLLAIAVFVAAIVVFSNGYQSVVRFFALPTPEGLLAIMGYLMLFLLVMTVLAFIMYASERQNGNVKVKNALFERLLGHRAEGPSGGQS